MNTIPTFPDAQLDVRGLEAPEPLERALEALASLCPGQRLELLIDREPHPLYGLLRNNDYVFDTDLLPGNGYRILIRKAD